MVLGPVPAHRLGHRLRHPGAEPGGSALSRSHARGGGQCAPRPPGGGARGAGGGRPRRSWPGLQRRRGPGTGLRQELAELDQAEGRGAWRDTPVGDAAMAWSQAVGEQRRCLALAKHAGLWERHQLRRQAALAAERELPLREAFERLAGPERARIGIELPEAEQRLAELEGQDLAHLRFEIAHPEVPQRLQHLDRQIASAAYDMALERQALDGIAPEVSRLPAPHPGIEREFGGPDLSIGLGL